MKIKELGQKQTAVTFVIAHLILLTCINPIRGAQPNKFPHLRKQGTATQLVVDDKPFLVLAGELGNSTSSNLDFMRPVWPKLDSLNLNTVLVPIYWELIEPTEGKFDFTLVDGLIQEARKHKLRLVPLWFAKTVLLPARIIRQRSLQMQQHMLKC